MKLSKNTLLFSLLASITLITGCKEKSAADSINQQQPDIQNPAMLAEFNKTIQIKSPVRNVVKDKNNNYGVSFSYQITNLSDKPIKSLKWLFAYKYQDEILYTRPFKLNFAELLTPKATFNVNFLIPQENLPKNTHGIFLDPQNQISSLVIGREVEFSDNSKIIVEN